MKRVTYLRALEIETKARGFLIWWHEKYQDKNNPNPSPTVKRVLNDIMLDHKNYGPAVYKNLKLTGLLRVLYPNDNIIWKEIRFKDGKETGYLIYSKKGRAGEQRIIGRGGIYNITGVYTGETPAGTTDHTKDENNS